MNKHWRIEPHDPSQVAFLEQHVGVPPVVAQLLITRGVNDPAEARRFLDGKLTGLRDPVLLPGVSTAVDRIHSAILEKRRIVIYGDYDADGMTGTGLLYRCLRLLRADVGYHVPNRLDEGYGLNDDALEKLKRRGASMIISVDCGIASIRQADTAKQLGIELIVTDHHQMADRLPDAVLVHPSLPGGDYPFAGLCGAGVALKLAWALCQRVSDAKKVTAEMREFLMAAVGLAAIGTVADVVPLIDENRILVKHGLTSLKHRPVPGLAALMKVTNLDQKPALSSEDIAFTLAPRLNAAGRLGQAQLGVELLTTDDPDRAIALAEYLHELNSSRDSLERSVYLAANKQAKEDFDTDSDAALVLAGTGWHAGVIGIVAGRLAEKYNRPVVIISWDSVGVKPGVGSARTACGIDLHAALTECSQHLLTHGGHAAAAGVKIESAQIDAFRAEFCEYVAGEVCGSDRVAEVRIDAEASLGQLSLGIVQQIEQLAPFGQANPRPVLCASGVTLAGPPKRMGKSERHLSLRLKQHQTTIRAVGFGQGDDVDALAQIEGPLDVAFRPVINDFRGRRTVEIHMVDWRVSHLPAAVGNA